MKKRRLQDSIKPAEKNSNKTKKKWLKLAPLVMCGMVGTMAIGETSASAHGYIYGSRAHIGHTKENNSLNWQQAENKYGEAVSTPQGVEGPKGFPLNGPVDGQLASGGNSGYSLLNIQTPLHWVKKDMKTGKNTLVWEYTAAHKTTKWHYYITKQGWDPSQPLNRDSLELIQTIDWDGTTAIPGKQSGTGLPHTINIPNDRSGYHVIYAVWDVDDTVNAFYQVLDVNIINDGEEDTEAPTIPTNLKATAGITKVNLKWTASTDNVGVSHYNIYRNGEKLPETTSELNFEDVNLQANTEYTYQVTAVDMAGNESEKSAPIKVKTKELPEIDTEAPTAPSGLHSMGETATTVDLMWTASTDNVGVDHYEVYRDGKRVHDNVSETRFTDSDLQPNTEYTYTVKAVDAAGNVSEASNVLNVKTKNGSIEEGTTTWVSEKVYNTGDRVLVDGIEYEAKWWTQGDIPEKSDAWKLISDVVVEWSMGKAYNGGDKVNYQGLIYEAKWWTQGDVPGKSDVWKPIRDVVVEWGMDKAYNGGDKVNYQGLIYEAKWWTQGDVPGKSDVWKKHSA
ncbi:lytic polysaccharide monooxygenase [Bacillus cereus]|uniref:Fibronectin type-III domain-containing protein n=1 Tax=Bacillus cereus TaxID=1396 RepID=A0A9X7G5I1_BACCE|nr:lytic polysaccharide monooxygenase [Bacillus cereus]PED40603.1 hypothetical protein CON26_29600 [Bacillus cereus]PFV02327.1 hypothetical protein COK98_27355 [Bacillus cereus]